MHAKEQRNGYCFHINFFFNILKSSTDTYKQKSFTNHLNIFTIVTKNVGLKLKAKLVFKV